MSELQFTIHPRLFHALFPIWLRRFFFALLASIPVYMLFAWLDASGIFLIIKWRLVLALIVVSSMYAGAKLKIKAIMLHRTQYKFYDTHVVIERKIVNAKRHSVPYGQITKITNNLNPWDRMTNTADITLHTSMDKQDFVLKSIQDPDAVEEKIYRLLKKAHHAPQGI